MAKKKDVCLICGNELTYDSGKTKNLSCYFCGNKFSVNTYCEAGHYVCDECHSKTAKEITVNFLQKTNLTNPFSIADEIMKHPKFNMYGPEHHFLVPSVILTALKNAGVKKPNREPIQFADVLEAIKRGSTIPGGYCGFYGSCGAGIGSGILISVFTGADPSKNLERSLANRLTARVLTKVADDLEHCCKRSVKYAISEALEFLTQYFKIETELHFVPEPCIFSSKNPKCEHQNCPFF